ncbi:hypothetical protein GCM10009001_29260 [Virgibacillus siamensis]|uniref:PPC domain-containing protein n=1 Tax=Virgibacillus siamensis TaxID=480071 RepID=A0ABN1GEV0_9BACI
MADRNDEHYIESIKGSNAQCIMGRLTKGVDLFEGLLAVCKQHNVQTAAFDCIGSLKRVGYVQLKRNDNKELRYSEPIYVEKPVELLAGKGFIGLDEHDELDVHYHGMYVDSDGNISGGHFLRGENPTAVTIEFTLHPVHDIYLKRKTDSSLNLPVFQFSERG